MSNRQDAAVGRKVFFLNPNSVMETQLIELVSRAEYEVYLIRDHQKARKILSIYPSSILFINIDEKAHSVDWVAYVRQFMSAPETREVRIGVFSYNDDPNVAQRYLIDLCVPCGFIRLKQGLMESARIIIQVLETNEARGRRKHVRASIPDDNKITFNVKHGRSSWFGRICDISAAGMACKFDQSTPVAIGQKMADIQLNLRSGIVSVHGAVVGIHNTPEGEKHVVVFAPIRSPDMKRKIQRFVYNTLQIQMDRVIAGL